MEWLWCSSIQDLDLQANQLTVPSLRCWWFLQGLASDVVLGIWPHHVRGHHTADGSVLLSPSRFSSDKADFYSFAVPCHDNVGAGGALLWAQNVASGGGMSDFYS